MRKMSLYFLYLKNSIRILFWKIRYGKKIDVDFIQCFGRGISLSISKNAKVSLKKGITSRNNLAIRVEGGRLTVQKGCFFNINCSITCLDNISIGEFCSFGNNIVIVDHDHDYKHISEGSFLTSATKIGNHVWIGANSVILRGSQIGNHSIIAAGSIVSGIVPDNSVFYQERVNKLKEIH